MSIILCFIKNLYIMAMMHFSFCVAASLTGEKVENKNTLQIENSSFNSVDHLNCDMHLPLCTFYILT